MNTKNEYVEKLHSKIDEWSTDIDRLKAKIERMEGETQQNLQNSVEELKARRDQMQTHLEDIRRSGDDAWQDLKAGAELAWTAMNEAVNSATSRFKT
jgi:outer membrane murein-binding lipoprotein Lpp